MGPVPFYRQIAYTLRSRILDGVYALGQGIPSALELEKAFGVSNITIRKALNELREDGWIETRRGIGSVVTKNTAPEFVDIKLSGNFTDWLQSTTGNRHNIRQKVVSIEAESGSLRIRKLLGAAEGQELWCMGRIRSVSGEPISYHVNYALPEQIGRIRKSDLAGGGSFIQAMQKRYPNKVARIEQFVDASVAYMDLAQILQIKFGDPIFWLEHQYLTWDEEVIVVAHIFLRGDRYRYTTTIHSENQPSAAVATTG